MNKCEQYCQTIKRMANAGGGGLPSEYQQVEYLRSSGNQYIDTGINPTSGSVLRVRIKIGGGNYVSTTIMGAQGTYRTASLYGYEGYALGIGIGNVGAVYSNTKFNCSTDSELDFTVDDTNKVVTGTRNNTALASTSYSNTYAGKNIYLYCNNYSNAQYSKVSIYYWECYINGTIMRNFIPCYRKSDNKPGMYDLVTQTFFTNAGTGEFTVGQDVL